MKTDAADDQEWVNSIYSRQYYLNECDGFLQFGNSKGKVLGKRLKTIRDMIQIKPAMKILDVGCGRGELVLHCARGRAYAWGIDLSAHAIAICNQTLSFWQKDDAAIKTFAQFQQCDAVALSHESQFFDCILLTDFVEHVPPDRLSLIFRELRRCLRKGGKLIIHTSPNRFYLPFMGRILALLSRILHIFPVRGYEPQKILPWNVRSLLPRGLQRDIHLNEQSSFVLRRLLKKNGFSSIKICFDLNPHYIDCFFTDRRAFQLVNHLKKVLPLYHLFYADLFCVAS